MSKLETTPAEEGATLLPKPKSTGIRRVVAAAALASFVIGVLAATAVRTSPGRQYLRVRLSVQERLAGRTPQQQGTVQAWW